MLSMVGDMLSSFFWVVLNSYIQVHNRYLDDFPITSDHNFLKWLMNKRPPARTWGLIVHQMHALNGGGGAPRLSPYVDSIT